MVTTTTLGLWYSAGMSVMGLFLTLREVVMAQEASRYR